MTSIFTPSTKISAASSPRDWAYELACLPQSANIVFTKETFLAFLKTHSIDVSPNYTEINKLPRYAQIGTLTASCEAPANEAPATAIAEKPAAVAETPAPVQPAVEPIKAAPAAPSIASQADASSQNNQFQHDGVRMHNPEVIDAEGNVFRPTRRVREPIGGGSAQISALFGGDDDGHDYAAEAARESARRRGLLQESNVQPKEVEQTTQRLKSVQVNSDDAVQSENTFRPSRRVREPGGTGGSSSIALG